VSPPIKVTPAQARRLEKNLSGVHSRTKTVNETSYILRILWAGWEAGRGRPPTVDEVRKLSVPMLNIAKRYLPELQRKTKPK
jgi:hypothetical protein